MRRTSKPRVTSLVSVIVGDEVRAIKRFFLIVFHEWRKVLDVSRDGINESSSALKFYCKKEIGNFLAKKKVFLMVIEENKKVSLN